MAAVFELGYPGMPTIYYGDEAGEFGSKDPDCRRTYPWGHEDKELQDFYKKAIAVRNDHKDVFARGSLKTLKAEGSIYAYERKSKDGKIGIVALNNGKAATVTIPVTAKDGTVFKHHISGKKFNLPRDIIKSRQERSRSITRQKSHEWQLVAFLFPWCRQGLTPRLIAKYSSVEPFANVVGDYACHNREKKQRSGFHYTTPLPCLSGGGNTKIIA